VSTGHFLKEHRIPSKHQLQQMPTSFQTSTILKNVLQASDPIKLFASRSKKMQQQMLTFIKCSEDYLRKDSRHFLKPLIMYELLTI